MTPRPSEYTIPFCEFPFTLFIVCDTFFSSLICDDSFYPLLLVEMVEACWLFPVESWKIIVEHGVDNVTHVCTVRSVGTGDQPCLVASELGYFIY